MRDKKIQKIYNRDQVDKLLLKGSIIDKVETSTKFTLDLHMKRKHRHMKTNYDYMNQNQMNLKLELQQIDSGPPPLTLLLWAEIIRSKSFHSFYILTITI